MRRSVLLAVLLLAGCSKSMPEADSPALSNAQSPAASGPDVGPTLTPGLAISYRYSFRVPIAQLGRTQEQHASRCEALGPTRCRIVGMEYHAGATRSMSATLDLRLAPPIARAFGRQSTAAVVGNGGMLTDAEITSTEAGARMAQADRSNASLYGEQRSIQAQLARPGMGGAERTQLEERLAALRDLQRGNAAQRAEATSTLASTPVRFNYESGAVDLGYTDGPILGGVKDGWRNIVLGTGVLLTVLISALPWVVGLGLIVWLWRRFGARLGLRSEQAD